jgi:hypothetical protein
MLEREIIGITCLVALATGEVDLFVEVSTGVDFKDSYCFSFNIEQYAKLADPQSVFTLTSR